MHEEYCVEIKRKIHLCNELNCKSKARDKTNKCIRHGGGKKCIEPNCQSSAREKYEKCKRHGGGPLLKSV